MKRRILFILAVAVIGLMTAWYAYASVILQPVQQLMPLAQLGGVPGRPLADVQDVFAVEELVYALDTDGLVILDASDPSSPYILSQLTLPGQGENLFVKDNRAYLSIRDVPDVYIVDVADPENPEVSKIIHFSGYGYSRFSDIFAFKDRLYVLTPRQLFGLDLEGDETPLGIWSAENSGDLFVREEGGRRYAYVTDIGYGYPYYRFSHLILDITDETSPEEISEFTTGHNGGGDIIVEGDYVYLSNGFLFDISDPAHPVAAGWFGGLGNTIALSGLQLYSSSSSVLDVSDPTFFPILAEPPEGQDGTAVSVSNGISFVAGEEEGLFVYRYLPRTVVTQRWEAEDGSITPPMLVQEDAEACGNAYVFSPDDWSNGSVAFQFDAPENDNYFIWGRVKGIDWSQNSFQVSIDDGEPFQYEIRPPDGVWHWGQVYPEQETPRPFGLQEGSHTIRFIAREANSLLDSLYITNYSGLHPEDAEPCTEPATPTPTPSPTATPLSPTTTPTPTPLPTPSGYGVVEVGRFGGHPLGGHSQVAVAQDSLLYVAHDDRLTVFDVSDPYQFQTVGQSDSLPGPITSLAIKDDYLFAQANGLTVVDARDPAHLHQAAYLPGLAGDVYVTDHRLYLVNEQTWMIFDISHPASPQKIGQVTGPHAQDIDFEGSRAYVVSGRRLSIFDLSNPPLVELLGAYYVPDGTWLREVIASDPFLYVIRVDTSGEYDSMIILDISDVAHPTERGLYSDWDRMAGLTLSGDTLYFSCVGHREVSGYVVYTNLYRYDVSDPDNPREINSVNLDEEVVPFAATSSRLYALYERGGDAPEIHVFQYDNLERLPLNPATNKWDGLPLGKSIGGSGQNAYLWDRMDIRVVDNGVFFSPVEIAKYLLSEESTVTDVYFSDTRAYISSGHKPSGETYVCIKDMINFLPGWCEVQIPVTSDSYDVSAQLITESKGYAFLHTMDYYWDEARTEIVDVRDLDNMVSVSLTTMLPADAEILDCCENDPYVAWLLSPETGPSHLLITPASQPDLQIGWLEMDHGARAIDIAGDVLYALTDQALIVVDISILDHPHEIGRLAFSRAQGEARALKMAGDQVYAGIGTQLRVVDVSDPMQPTEKAVFNAPDSILGIHIHDDVISVAVNESGMINLVELPAKPQAITDLVIAKDGLYAKLTWSAVVEDILGEPLGEVSYNVYRSIDDPYFTPDIPYASGVTTTTYSDPDTGVITDPNSQAYYIVTAVSAGRESGNSNRVGAFNFALTPGSP